VHHPTFSADSLSHNAIKSAEISQLFYQPNRIGSQLGQINPKMSQISLDPLLH